VTIVRPTYRNLPPRPGEHLLKPIRQLIESVNDTLKGQLDLELHGGRTAAGSASASPSGCWPCPPPSGTTATPPSP
jgi:hypothetical protein